MPFSEVLLFNPPGGHSLSASGGDCVDVGLLFTAAKGKVLSGQIVPPIAGVTIILEGGLCGTICKICLSCLGYRWERNVVAFYLLVYCVNIYLELISVD